MSTNGVYAKLADDLNWFVVCSEIRVLHIETSATERSTVLELVATTESHADNHSPFLIIEDAHTRDADGWIARAERAGVIHEQRRQGMKQLAALPPVMHEGNPLAVFGWRLLQLLEAQRGASELRGLMVILAPTVLEEARAFAESIRSFLRVPELNSVRFIIIELDDSAASPLLDGLGNAGMRVGCVVDPSQHRREQSELLAAIAAAPPGASPEVSAGGAGPRDRIPPPRAGRPPRDAPLSPETSELLARELGPAAALVGASGAYLKRCIAGAALAVQERRFGEAVNLQSQACEHCWRAGLTRLGCILEVTLGGYCLHGGDPARAKQAFDVAAKRAESFGLHDVAAQALLGLAAVLVLERNLPDGAMCYARAGEAAERAASPILAIEAYRTSGQIALQAGGEQAAIGIWQRALGVAGQSGPEVAAASSAPIVARSLAMVMQDRHSYAAAESLLSQADEIERSSAGPKSAEPSKHPTSDAPGAVHAG